MARLIQSVIISLLRGYQLVCRPLLGNRCRFYPSCSDYAIEALTYHGFCKGSWYTLRRLLCCHPLHPGGFDYVPPHANKKSGNHG